jgi:outer membrane murein-binding lipoprotein Lpp
VREAITVLRRQKAPVSSAALARRAGVSRTFLYENIAARALVAGALGSAIGQRGRDQTEHDDQQQASWRERALNAEDGLKAAYAEIRVQRARIAELMGNIRDLEQRWSTEDIQRITTENTTLKQRVRQLSGDNRTTEERLQAARSNGRFQDRKIAQLEAQLAEHVPRG